VPPMLRMNFISLSVTNSADGGRRSYPKLSKCNKTAGFRRIPRWEERLRPLVSYSPVVEWCPLVGVPPSATTDITCNFYTLWLLLLASFGVTMQRVNLLY